MEATVAGIKQLLRSKHKLVVPDDWLEACIEWVQGEHEASFVGDNR